MKGGAVCDGIESYEEISNRSLQDFKILKLRLHAHIFLRKILTLIIGQKLQLIGQIGQANRVKNIAFDQKRRRTLGP